MSFAHYLLQVNLYLIVFYGFYKLLLDKETYFTLNRIYLVAAGVLSLCIPFIRLEWLTEQKAAQQVYSSVNWEAVLQQATIVTESNSGFTWANFLVYLYSAGVLFFLGRLVLNLLKVSKLMDNDKSGAAFSFFSKKFIDQDLPQTDVIAIHEEAHIKQWHTADILFFELLGILNWLNPIIYLYKKDIKNIHEFLADQLAADYQGDKAEYAMLLLSKSFGISPNALTNGFFNQSLIKKRIFMLHKERSKKTAIMKYGIFIPLFALLIVFSSATVRKNEKLIALSNQIPLEKPIEMVQEMVSKPSIITVKTKPIVEVRNHVDVHWKVFYQFLSKSLRYPKNAQENDLQGNTQIKFILKNGKVNNVSTQVNLGDGCEEEVMKAILSYKGFKNIPDGSYAIKVGFRLSDSESKIINENIKLIPGYKNLSAINIRAYEPTIKSEPLNNSDKKLYDFVSIEKQPEFPGGIRKFYDFLGKTIRYPKLAQQNNVQGKVFLSFIVEKNGSLSDVKVTRGLGSGTDEEAIRVIQESPKWNPGILNGLAVRVKYNINVNFTLNGPDENSETKGLSKNITENDYGLNKVPFKLNTNALEGQNPPLIVIDGVLQDNVERLKFIDPQTIASINILKDNSATTAYGPKGKNGVILITSKMVKGNFFRKPEAKELTIDKISNLIELKEKF